MSNNDNKEMKDSYHDVEVGDLYLYENNLYHVNHVNDNLISFMVRIENSEILQYLYYSHDWFNDKQYVGKSIANVDDLFKIKDGD